VKLVSECLGVSRSQLTVRIKQSASPKVRRRRLVNDTELVAEIKQQVSELPSYGYRRVWGLLRREREVQLLTPINVKRVYRVMRDHNLLLERRIKQPGVQKAELPLVPAIPAGARTASSSVATTVQS
jgi:putative transposase